MTETLETHTTDRKVEPCTSSGTIGSRQLILMRGIPSCGKSYTSRRLAQDLGATVFEFDEFFYTQVGDHASSYDWSIDLMPQARRWNLARILAALSEGITPLIIDSDNIPGPLTRAYVSHAIQQDYRIEFQEPESPWWAQLRRLLEDKQSNADLLEAWARKLTALNKATHRVPLADMRRRIQQWNSNLTVDDILRSPGKANTQVAPKADRARDRAPGESIVNHSERGACRV